MSQCDDKPHPFVKIAEKWCPEAPLRCVSAIEEAFARSAEGNIAKERDGWKDQCRILGDDLARCKQELAARAAANHGEVWYWQGDGQDHPESLTCPVIIAADKLRALLQSHEGATEPPQDWKDLFEMYRRMGLPDAWLYQQIAAHHRRAEAIPSATGDSNG